MELFVAVGLVHGGFENAWSRLNLLQYALCTGSRCLRRGVGGIMRAICKRISALTWRSLLLCVQKCGKFPELRDTVHERLPDIDTPVAPCILRRLEPRPIWIPIGNAPKDTAFVRIQRHSRMT